MVLRQGTPQIHPIVPITVAVMRTEEFIMEPERFHTITLNVFASAEI